jgi:hypothetical protein
MPLQAAAALTRRFREHTGKGAALGGMIGKQALEELLSQPGCEGLRIYYGREESGHPALVLVGVNSSDADMTSGTILEQLFPCPPICGDPSALNS